MGEIADMTEILTPAKPLVWSREMAVELCTLIQGVSPPFNAHPALTGGLLYKEGMRKDCDIVIYRRGDTGGVRPDLNWDGLWKAMEAFGLRLIRDYGYVKKCLWIRHDEWLPVDVFDVVQDGGNYPDPGDSESNGVAEDGHSRALGSWDANGSPVE